LTEPVEEKRVLEDVLDEVLSFNFRSLRTLRDIFLRPGHIAQTFARGDRDTYTPVMRVWFGVISWLFILSIIWGGYGAVIMRASAVFDNQLDPFIVEGRRDMDAVIDGVSMMSGMLTVPITAFFILLGPPFLRQFNKTLTSIQAIQCYFIPVTAMAVMGTILLTLSTWEPGVIVIAPWLNYGLFALTSWRIMRPTFARSRIGAAFKTIGLTLVVFVLSVFATLLTFAISIAYALITVPPVGG
jgi:hypothetical protein